MNDLMSFGLHRVWKQEFVNLIDIDNRSVLLDLASGSGDIIKLIRKNYDCLCIGYDANINMIKQAQKKIDFDNVFFVNGLAEKIPFKKECFDAVTVSFGLRNFSDIQQSLKEIKRVLKKGRKFYCLEFSHVNNVFLNKIFKIYSHIIPFYGKVFLNNEEAYSYLVESIKRFPNQIELTKKLIKTGFKNIEVIDILDGIASIHISES